jgi:ferredoxin
MTARPADGTASHPAVGRPLVTSPRPPANDPEAPLARRSPYARWRALTLILVYVLMAAHVVHWQLAGKTLAPLELHEVMYTAELGIVTAGFLFMAAAMLATAVFGRFFCGWGCHLLALQDLAGWMLEKLHIRRKPIRARIIAWAPFLVMLYMFVWPQLTRFCEGRPHPGFRFADDSESIASFTTTNFWRNLPGPWVAALTFLVCGGLIVYVLGSRGFCTYACPYGALFRLLDRLAPGKVRVDLAKCQQCGTCTKVCTSGIPVHDQVRVHGAVVDPRCMKDLDCVGACPHDALGYAFGVPSLLLRRRAGEVMPVRAREFSLGEELAMAAVFLSTLVIFRGLYGVVPFLLSVGLGATAAYAAVLSWRLLWPGEVTLGRKVLRTVRGWTRLGRAFAAAATVFALFAAHSAVVRWAQWRGDAAYVEARALPASQRGDAVRDAVGWLGTADRWSLWPSAERKAAFAWAQALAGDGRAATQLLAEATALAPDRGDYRYYYAGFLARAGDRARAIAELREAARLDPQQAVVHQRLGELLQLEGDGPGAQAELELAARLSGGATR